MSNELPDMGLPKPNCRRETMERDLAADRKGMGEREPRDGLLACKSIFLDEPAISCELSSECHA